MVWTRNMWSKSIISWRSPILILPLQIINIWEQYSCALLLCSSYYIHEDLHLVLLWIIISERHMNCLLIKLQYSTSDSLQTLWVDTQHSYQYSSLVLWSLEVEVDQFPGVMTTVTKILLFRWLYNHCRSNHYHFYKLQSLRLESYLPPQEMTFKHTLLLLLWVMAISSTCDLQKYSVAISSNHHYFSKLYPSKRLRLLFPTCHYHSFQISSIVS